MSALANITRDFKVVASYTNYELFVSKDLDQTLIGKVPTSRPRQVASLWTDYTIREGSLDGLGFGGGVRYVGSSFADNMNTLSVPAVVLGDLAVHYEWANQWRAGQRRQHRRHPVCRKLRLCYVMLLRRPASHHGKSLL